MVVVVILGILAATIIPQFIGTKQEAQINAAKASIAELESALERFYIHLDRHPTTEEGLKALVDPPSADDKKWRGPYIKLLRPDPWGNPYQYEIPGSSGRQVLTCGREAPMAPMAARETAPILGIGDYEVNTWCGDTEIPRHPGRFRALGKGPV